METLIRTYEASPNEGRREASIALNLAFAHSLDLYTLRQNDTLFSLVYDNEIQEVITLNDNDPAKAWRRFYELGFIPHYHDEFFVVWNLAGRVADAIRLDVGIIRLAPDLHRANFGAGLIQFTASSAPLALMGAIYLANKREESYAGA